MRICIASRREHTSKALRYGTRSQGISQFYLHTPRWNKLLEIFQTDDPTYTAPPDASWIYGVGAKKKRKKEKGKRRDRKRRVWERKKCKRWGKRKGYGKLHPIVVFSQRLNTGCKFITASEMGQLQP